MLGEMTVSVLKGEDGFQRKEIHKLIDWLKTEPPLDVINLPYTLLISLAEPLKQALNRPVLCTLQGEDLFLDGLTEPYRTEAMDLIRKQLDHVDLFLSVSEYYAGFMPGYLGIPEERRFRSSPWGSIQTVLNYASRTLADHLLLVFSHESRRKKDCTYSRKLTGCCASRAICRKRDSRLRVTWLPTANRIWPRSKLTSEKRNSATSFIIVACSIALRRSPFCAGST
jgi:hypothetical protein